MITLAVTNVGTMISDFGTAFSSIFSFVTDNWLLSLLLFFPIGIGLVAGLMKLFR